MKDIMSLGILTSQGQESNGKAVRDSLPWVADVTVEAARLCGISCCGQLMLLPKRTVDMKEQEKV